jgi:hypothetical protein
MISCEQFISQLSNYLDGQVDVNWQRQMAEHSRHCAPCEVVLETTRKTVQMIGQEEYFDIPSGVSDRIHLAIDRMLSDSVPIPARPAVKTPLSSWFIGLFRPVRLAIASAALVAVLVVGWSLLTTTTVYGWLIDAHCAHDYRGRTAAQHPVGCNLGEGCKEFGWGVMMSSGQYLKFDAAGDQRARHILETTKLTQDLEIQVTGRREGNEFVVRRMTVLENGAIRSAQNGPSIVLASR